MSTRNTSAGRTVPFVRQAARAAILYNRASIARKLLSGLSRQIVALLIVFSLFIAFLALPAKFTRWLPTASAAGTVLASWGFDGVTTTNTGTAPVVSVGSAAADSGVLTAGSAFTALHTSASTVWSNPAGNGSTKSVSSNNWAAGDYYQFSFGTSGNSAINITWDQTGSATGPRDFKVQYKYKRFYVYRCDRHKQHLRPCRSDLGDERQSAERLEENSRSQRRFNPEQPTHRFHQVG